MREPRPRGAVLAGAAGGVGAPHGGQVPGVSRSREGEAEMPRVAAGGCGAAGRPRAPSTRCLAARTPSSPGAAGLAGRARAAAGGPGGPRAARRGSRAPRALPGEGVPSRREGEAFGKGVQRPKREGGVSGDPGFVSW